jgi:hypothetical protein
MENPLALLESKVEGIIATVTLKVEITLLRTQAKFVLNQLASIDPDRAVSYAAALKEIE